MSITFTTTNAPDPEPPLTVCLCAQDCPSFSAIVDGEVSVLDCAEEVARHAWSECPSCKGTGMEDDYVPDPHELNVAYGAQSRLLRMLGLDPEPCGRIELEAIPGVIRAAVRALNSERHRRPFQLAPEEGPRSFSPGITDERLRRYAERFLALAKYAQEQEEAIVWG